ncbi:MAG TPA: glycosyltransferase family 4 protein [Gammaproteobacteria bacterium]|nr:glycosyltransferase family 4 protein [Gammaproteobacteria bacterium]
MNALYFVDQFPKLSETFVRDEAVWMEEHSHLAGIVALKLNDALLPDIPGTIHRKIHRTSLRYVRRLRRPFIVIYWLLRAPRRFLIAYRLLLQDRTMQRYFWNAARTAREVKGLKPNIVHAHFASDAAQIARFVSCILNAPFTLCVHHYDIFLDPPENYGALAASAAHVVTISNYNRNYLINKHNLPANKLDVIHCGVSIGRFYRTVPYPEIGTGPLALVSVGRLVHVKGHQYLIDACANLLASGIDFHLTIIGDGPRHKQLEERIQALGLADHVELAGAQSSDAVREYLERSHIFVMPSLSEGIPVALMEAMIMEIPVIATRIKGIPELVEDGCSGLLVAAEDAEQLSAAITRLLNDSDMRTRLGGRGRRVVLERFNACTEYGKLLRLWSQATTETGA